MLAFALATAVAASTARRASRVHGGSLNQLTHEVRGLIVVRAILGLIVYAALASWLFWSSAVSWSYLPIPPPLRWVAAALLLPALAYFAWSFRTLGTT